MQGKTTLSLAATLAAALTLAACESPTNPTSTSSSSTPSLAVVEKTNSWDYQFHYPVIIPFGCGRMGQEIVPMDGKQHFMQWISQNKDGSYHFRVQNNVAELVGTGLVSGDTYRGAGTDLETFDTTLPSTVFVTYNFVITSPYGGGHIVAHETLKQDLDADGYPIYPPEVINFHAECK